MMNLPDIATQTVRADWQFFDGALDSGWAVENFWAHWGLFAVGIVGFVLLVVMGFIWFERRFISPFQLRIGPNRCGPFGLLQPVADAVKVML